MGACASTPIDLKNMKAPEPEKEETVASTAPEQVRTDEGPKEEKALTTSDEVCLSKLETRSGIIM